jgi:PD-(D/E)XK nuclease superfamily protein
LARDTGTGAVLEAMVLPALQRGGYVTQTQVLIGQRWGGGRHLIDVLAQDKDGGKFLVSMKWQQVSGTAEQKVPFEAICLAEAIRESEGGYSRAYLVLGGNGWKLREFYVGGGLDQHLNHGATVKVLTLEDFVAKANRGLL